MTINELIIYGNKYLSKNETYQLLGLILAVNYLELGFHLNRVVNQQLCGKFIDCVKKINEGIPLQYATNSSNFYGYDYYVDNRVLIPRFETEELVDNALKYISKYFNNPKILDLCAGSGVIGLTLKMKHSNIDITLSDISDDALEVLKINKDRYMVNATIIKSDLFKSIDDKYDVIISNPPYVSINDAVDCMVIDNEPHIALYASDNGYYFYEEILKTCEKYLNKRYMIGFEIGNSQKDGVIKLINKYLKNVRIECFKDNYLNDRMIFIFKNIE